MSLSVPMRAAIAPFALSIAFLTCVQATASPVTLELEGNVHDIFPTAGALPLGSISVGDALSLRLTYDPASLPLVNFIDPPATAIYQGSLAYTLWLPGYQRSGQTQAAFYVSDNASYSGSTDEFDRLGWNAGDVEADQDHPPFDFGSGTYFESFNLTFVDDGATALSGFSFPEQLPFSAFSQRSINLVFFNDDGRGLIVQANLNAREMSAVPEPSSWSLLISGFAIIGLTLRGRRLRRPGSILSS